MSDVGISQIVTCPYYCFFIYKANNKYIKNREKYNCIVGIFNIVKIKLLKRRILVVGRAFMTEAETGFNLHILHA